MSGVLQVLIAMDQVANTLIGGMADETLSARAWRLRRESRAWARAVTVIDALFWWQPGHCADAFYAEIERRQAPGPYRL
jgi:hypothetical protein